MEDYLKLCLQFLQAITFPSVCGRILRFLPNYGFLFTLFIFATQCRRHQVFQTTNSVRSSNLSLKYQRLTSLGCKDKGMIKFEFVAKTQLLSPCFIVWFESWRGWISFHGVSNSIHYYEPNSRSSLRLWNFTTENNAHG